LTILILIKTNEIAWDFLLQCVKFFSTLLAGLKLLESMYEKDFSSFGSAGTHRLWKRFAGQWLWNLPGQPGRPPRAM
jgi:hypothetical protein